MQDHTRRHERIPAPTTIDVSQGDAYDGLAIADVLPRPLYVFTRPRSRPSPGPSSRPNSGPGAPHVLWLHFHGASFIVRDAVHKQTLPIVGVSINLGAGSRAYGQPFEDPRALDRIIDAVSAAVAARDGRAPAWRAIVLSGFSAGYGAIRQILRTPALAPRIDGVLLLDGIHASYDPDERVLAEGGRVRTADLDPFTEYARRAADVRDRRRAPRFTITHSEIFPGTFASTTEAVDELLAALALRRTPVLRWGPVGMQQLSEAGRGRFQVMGFAGNTAPDHVDHLHAASVFLKRVLPD